MSLPARKLRFMHIGRTVRTRQRLIFLVIGALVLIAGIALRNLVACVCGMLIVGSFAWDTPPGTPEGAHVHLWQWLHKTTARRR